uniref:PEThy; ZPT4-2 n=1 Tax=Petunia hybrida TaxID=4102 RepID=P93718_PETHY|nr:PEThy; ZPT4-2 [Petunia x hybrida]
MEEGQDLKYFCKLCNKRYPCGKSFGGHMRSHVLANSAKLEEKVEFKQKKVPSWTNGGKIHKRDHKSKFEHGEHSGYGLRDNPKKTWRISDSRSPLPRDNVCQQCGKVFQSLKALCGHMACHSGKDRGMKDDNSWTSETKNLVMDSNSDTEAEEPRLRSKSNSKRYNRLIAKSSSFCFVNNKSVSSSVSEIDDQEQEEVAKCLMMLSMDTWICNGVNSIVESSDNNSVVLETKSSSVDMKIERKDSPKCVNNLDETPRSKKKADRNLKLDLLNAEAQSENSDSEYFLGEYKKVESDASVDEFHRNGNYQWNTSNTSLGCWFDESGPAEKKELTRMKNYVTDSRKDLSKDYKYDSYGMVSHLDKRESRKRIKDSSYPPNLSNETFKNVKPSFKSPEGSKHTQKKKKYECLNCKKTFSSYQALGGHRPCNKNTNAYFESTYETGENSRDADNGPNYINKGKHRETLSNKPAAHSHDYSSNPEKKMKPKKFKGHACPFCPRMFKSGQALGGHKRSHFIVSSENHYQASAVQGKIVDLLDLNLPAPVEDVNGEPAFVSW